MLLLQAQQIEKTHAEQLILRLDTLSLYRGDKIGIVGPNGAGKTTLLNILAGMEPADSGEIQRYGKMAVVAQEEGSYSSQVQSREEEARRERAAKELGLRHYDLDLKNLSGGEATKWRIAEALGTHADILLADEPTSHVDMEGIQYIEEQFKAFPGAVILVSHDRRLLDQVCTKIIEIQDTRVTEYIGNYSAYREQKELERQTQEQDYMKYVQEKKRLNAAIVGRTEQAKAIKKAPKRMGNSEARLHRREAGESRKKLESAKKALETRLEKLEKKEKPAAPPEIKMELHESLRLHAKYTLLAEQVQKKMGKRTLFQEVSFQLKTGSKTALVGPNGCGKSTFLQMLLKGEQGLTLAQGSVCGYFSQRLEGLDGDQMILEHVSKESVHSEYLVRTVLARMGFRRDAVYKQIGNLSGGEKVKVALSKLLLGQYNVLLLDEPTNYLDVYALEALEELLLDYQGTLLFVTHDREFVDRVADHVLVFDQGKLQYVEGNYTQYLELNRVKKQRTQGKQGKQEIQEQILLLENKLQHIIGKLSIPSPEDHPAELEEEYQQVLRELKRLRSL